MLPENLLQYLKDCKSKNLAFSDLAAGLQQSGYSPDQISQAKIWYESNVQSSPPQPQVTPQIVKSKKNPFLMPILLIGFLLFLVSSVSVGAYLVATEKIDLKNSKLRDQISKVVFSLPVVPKPPKFVLAKSVEAHEKIAKNSFDLSFSVQSNDFQSSLGLNSIDVVAKGFADYADVNKPIFSLDLDVTREFSAKLRKKDANLYIKVDKIPVTLYPLLGLEPDKLQPLLDNWLVYDTSPLESEARKALEKMDKPESGSTTTDKIAETTLRRILEEDVLPYLQMTSDKLDNASVYKITFKPTPDQLDKLGDELEKLQLDISKASSVLGTSSDKIRPSEIIQNLSLTWWVDQKSYYLKKLELSSLLQNNNKQDIPTLETNPLPVLPESSVSLAMVLKMADFGQDVLIETPSSALTPEQFYQKITETTGFTGLPGMLNSNYVYPSPSPLP